MKRVFSWLLLFLMGAIYGYSQAPTATFSYTYVGGDSCAQDATSPQVQFAFVSYSNVDSFCVNFGDGNVQCFTNADVGNPFTHTYSLSGFFTVAIRLYKYGTPLDSNLVFVPVRIYGKISPPIIQGPDSICVGETYLANGLGLGDEDIDYWVWNFSNGHTESNVTKATTSFSSPSAPLDTVSLIAYGPCDSDTVIKTFEVKSSVIENFFISFPSDSVCVGDEFYLTVLVDQISRTYNYSMIIDWGDGNIDTTSFSFTHSHTYDTPGTYTYIATLVTPCGTFSDTDSVVVGPYWGASVSFNPQLLLSSPNDTLCKYSPVQVYPMGASSNTKLVTIFWGDGDTTVIGNNFSSVFQHYYSTAGSYQIVAKFENNCGYVKYDTLEVTLVDTAGYPIVPFVVNVYPTSVCPNGNVSFDFMGYPYYTYKLVFDDGNDTTITPTVSGSIYLLHSYTSPGTYNPELIVFSQCGDTDTVAVSQPINVTTTSGLSGLFLNYSSNKVCPNANIGFSLNGSLIYYNNYTSIKWDMGDGTVYYDSLALNHSYSSPGLYVVFVEVTSICGDKKYVSVVIEVKNTTIPRNVSWSVPPSTCVGTNFNVIAYIYPLFSDDTLIIDFGDGSMDTLIGHVTATHTYTTPGAYTVSYILKPVCGNILTDSAIVVVQDYVNAEILISDTVMCAGKPITFTANTLNNYTNVTYYWRITDMYSNIIVSDTGNSLTHTFLAPGMYTVTLFGTGACGMNRLDVAYVTIKEPTAPTASFTATVSRDTVYITNNSVDADYYYWDFGDGHTQWGNVAYHVYTANGTYTITLIAYNCDTTTGQTDTVTQNVTITTVNVISQSVSDVKVYPNPTNDVLMISAPNQNFNVSIRTIIGTEVMRYEGAQNVVTLSLKELPAGIYFVEVFNKNEKVVRKIIKE